MDIAGVIERLSETGSSPRFARAKNQELETDRCAAAQLPH